MSKSRFCVLGAVSELSSRLVLNSVDFDIICSRLKYTIVLSLGIILLVELVLNPLDFHLNRDLFELLEAPLWYGC